MDQDLSEWINPLVSVVLTTHDRPHFLPMALACYQHQTYGNRELIVVDDSVHSIDHQAVSAAGGYLLPMEPGTPLGVKLNRGFAEARGSLCHKMDDDDWYGPDFLQRMVEERVESSRISQNPDILCMVNYPFFDLAHWELRLNTHNEMSGATLLFSKLDWEDCPFRPIPQGEDTWFIWDRARVGGHLRTVGAHHSFLQVRHRDHLWLEQLDGTPLDEHISRCPRVEDGPESFLPGWAIAFYRNVQDQLLGQSG